MQPRPLFSRLPAAINYFSKPAKCAQRLGLLLSMLGDRETAMLSISVGEALPVRSTPTYNLMYSTDRVSSALKAFTGCCLLT